MATKAKTVADPESCLNRADPEEPVFVLRAHDRHAAGTVRQWASARAGSHGYDEAFEEALVIADAMDEWRKTHG